MNLKTEVAKRCAAQRSAVSAKGRNTPEQRLERIRRDREQNQKNQEACQCRLRDLKKADAALAQEESRIVMEMIHRNAVQRYGENYTTRQLLEYLNCLEPEEGEEPCVSPAQSPNETEPCVSPAQSAADEEPCVSPAQSPSEADTQ